MQFKFDHLVHFVEEPKQAMEILKSHGIFSVEGGAHQHRSTYNSLSYFGLSYIEYISTFDKQSLMDMEHPKFSMMETLIQGDFTEGFLRFILRTDNIQEAARFFRSKGLIVHDQMPLSRKRPDGSLLEWQLLFMGKDAGGLQLPYIIQWNESDEEREKELRSQNIIVPHPSGASFSHVTFAVKNAEATANRWAQLFDFPKGARFIDESLDANCHTLELEGGNLVFASPIEESVGAIAEFLEKFGEKPYRVNLSSSHTESEFSMLGGQYKITQKK